MKRQRLKSKESTLAFNEQKSILVQKVRLKSLTKHNKNKIREVNLLDKVLHSWTSPKQLRHYFTEGRQIEKYRDVLNEPSPYSISECSVLRRGITKKEKKYSSQSKHYTSPTYRGKMIRDILCRVHVPQDTTKLPWGIRDFNDDFFSLVRGRPTTQVFDRAHYINTLNQILYYDILSATYNDRSKLFDEQYILNYNYIKSIIQSYEEARVIINELLHEDESEAIDVIKMHGQILSQHTDRVEELHENETFTESMKSSIKFLFDQLNRLLRLKEMVVNLSPSSWKNQFDKKMKHWKPEDVDHYSTLKENYIIYICNETDIDPDVGKIFNKCTEFCSKIGPKGMYFDDITEIEAVFKDIEGQGLSSSVYLSKVSKTWLELDTLLQQVEHYYREQIRVLDASVASLERRINYNLNRAKTLNERLNKKADSWFKEAIVGEETMLIKTLIQSLYDELVGPKSRTMSSRDMLEELESRALRLKIEVESVPSSDKNEEMKSFTENKILVIEKAERAKEREKRLRTLLHQMESLYQPRHRMGKPVKPRSRPPTPDTIQTYSAEERTISTANVQTPLFQVDPSSVSLRQDEVTDDASSNISDFSKQS